MHPPVLSKPWSTHAGVHADPFEAAALLRTRAGHALASVTSATDTRVCHEMRTAMNTLHPYMANLHDPAHGDRPDCGHHFHGGWFVPSSLHLQ